MEIQVKEIFNRKELQKFVRFPLSLYRGNSYYVPPILNEELNDLDKNKNPVFDHAEARYFLALKNGQIVGRIAAIINLFEINQQKKPKMRFGWFDVVDDIEVTKALLKKVTEIGRSHGLEYIEGPVGFSNLDRAGLLTEGFDKIATSITLYNHEYYKTHLETLGFDTASEWVENYLSIPEKLPEKVTRLSQIIQKKYNLKCIKFKKTSDIEPYIKPIFKLLEETYGSLESFVPISDKQIEHYKKIYLKILKPEFINCIVDETGELCSFAITSPSYARALQKANGKLLFLGWYHLLTAPKNTSVAESILIGIHPKYQKKGITSLIFCEIFSTFQKYGLQYMETNPQLIDNLNVQLLWTDFSPLIHKRRKTFRKNIR